MTASQKQRSDRRHNALCAIRGLGLMALAVAVIWGIWWFTCDWRSFLGGLLSLWMFPVLFGIASIEQFAKISAPLQADAVGGGVEWLVDDSALAVKDPSGEREYRMRYDDLVRVEIVTTDGGPFVEDFFYELFDGESWMTVPLGVACDLDLVDHLFALPGFDHAVVIEASASTQNRRFVAWEADWGTVES